MTREWKEGEVKKEQPSACNRGGKRQKLTADDIDKKYLDSKTNRSTNGADK
jgi:hypothetical protein